MPREEGLVCLTLAFEGLELAGDIKGAVRVMPPCMAMGHAAGIAAALAAAGSCKPRSIDASEVRQKLLEQGAFLG